MSIWSDISDFFKNLFGKPPPFPINPQQLIGYGPVNIWYKVDAKSLAKQLRNEGCNATSVEFLCYSQDGYYDNPSKLFDPYNRFIDAMRKQGILTKVNIANWNHGKGGNSPSGRDICSSFYSVNWFNSIFNHMKKQGTEGVMMQAASEWADAHKECTKKAEQFCNIVAQNWSGWKSWNKGSRPKTAPGGHTIEYHPLSTKDFGPGGVILTDTTSILNEFGGLNNFVTNHQTFRKYAKGCKQKGRGFVHYGFSNKGIDSGAIKDLGVVVKELGL